MATLTLALDRCYGWFCRAFPGHAADPRHQLASCRDRCRFTVANTRTRHPPRRDRDRFPGVSPEARPSWRAELSAIDVQQPHLSFIEAGRAKRVELRTVRRQNAAFNCRRLSRRRVEPVFAVALQGVQSRWLP